MLTTHCEQRQTHLHTLLQPLITAKLLTPTDSKLLIGIAKTVAAPVKGMIVYLISHMTLATQARWTQAIQVLLANNPDLQDKDYAYFFRKAAEVTAVDSLQILIDLKLPINAYIGSETLLDHAIITGNTALAKRLIALPGIKLNSQDPKWSFTPLHYAVQHQQTTIIALLLEQKVHLHLTTTYGWTALEMAIKNNAVHIVVLFKQFYPTLPEMEIGKNAKKIALAGGNQAIIDLLTVHATHNNAPSVLQKLKTLLFSKTATVIPSDTSKTPLLTPAEQTRANLRPTAYIYDDTASLNPPL